MTIDKTRRSCIKSILSMAVGIPVVVTLPQTAFAGIAKVYTRKSDNKALNGYDSVAYFKQNKPVEGLEKFQTQYNGADWYFSSQENRDEFIASPESFAPQYGGYCAFSVAQGKVIKGDPELWAIEADKLYLNYNKGAHRLWLKRVEKMISKGDKNWPRLLG